MYVQDVNVADNEAIILEWKVALESKSSVPYAYDPKPNVKRKAFSRESRLPEAMQEVEDPD